MHNQWHQIQPPHGLSDRIMQRVKQPPKTHTWQWATVWLLLAMMASGGYWHHQQQASQTLHRDILVATWAIETWWAPDPPDGGIWLY